MFDFSDNRNRPDRFNWDQGHRSQKFFIENTSQTNNDRIYFVEYGGPHDEKHSRQKLFLPTKAHNSGRSTSNTYEEYSKYIKEILASISQRDLSDYIISLKLGVVYFYSPRFRFRKTHSLNEIAQLLQGDIPVENEFYYITPRSGQYLPSFPLRKNFAEVKTVDQTSLFAERLSQFGFRVVGTKHLFRMYLTSEDKARHNLVIDPSFNYSITELSENLKQFFNIGKFVCSLV